MPRKPPTPPHRCLYGIVASLVIAGLLCGLGLRFSKDGVGNTVLAENAIRSFLLSKADSSRVLPTYEVATHSPHLFDHDLRAGGLLPLENKVWFGPPPHRAVRVRADISYDTQVVLHSQIKAGRKITIVVSDDQERKLFACRNGDCSGSHALSPASSRLLRVVIKSDQALERGETLALEVSRSGPSKAAEVSIPKLDLKLSAATHLYLNNLLRLAKKGSSRTRDQTFRAEISQAGSAPSQGRFSLAGRTESHLSFPPSLNGVIESGPALLGTQYFKLYRPETRGGVLDFVASSLLSDIGLKTKYSHLVRLHINGKFQGIYLFEEQPSPAFFEHMVDNESPIYRFDFNNLNASRGRFKSEVAYSSSPNAKYPSELPKLEDPDFVDHLDRAEFATFLAATLAVDGSHAWSNDDLRLYHNALDGKFHAFVSDLKVGLERDWMSTVDAMSPGRPVGVGLWKPLYHFSTEEKHPRQAYGMIMANLHPVVIHFLARPENRKLVENRLLTLASRGFSSALVPRFERLEQAVLAAPWVRETEKELFESGRITLEKVTKPSHWTRLRSNGRIYFRQDSPKRYTFANPLPLSVAVRVPSSASGTCGQAGKTGYLAPVGYRGDGSGVEFRWETTEILKSPDPGASSLCEVKFAERTTPAEMKQRLRFTLADGTRIPPVEKKKGGRSIGSQPQGKRHKVFLSLFDVHEDGDWFAFRWAYHKSHTEIVDPAFSALPLLLPVEGKAKLRVEVDEKVFNKKGTGGNPAVQALSLASKTQWGHPASLFGVGSRLITLRVKKPERSISVYTPLNALNDSVRKVFGEEGGDFFIVDSGAMLLPGMGQEKEAESTPSFLVREGNNRVRIPAGTQAIVSSTWTVSKGETLIVEKGSTLRFEENAGIRVDGEIRVEGTASAPVRFLPRHRSWRGITLIDTPGDNVFRHLIFSKAREFSHRAVNAFGALSVVRSHLTLDHFQLVDIPARDALNVYHGTLKVKNSQFSGTVGDTLDSDFSFGSVEESVFLRSEADGLDLNQSRFLVDRTQFRECNDKGISVGEKSVLLLSGSTLEGNTWGVAVKDSGIAQLTDNEFKGNETGIGELIKKPWYALPYVHAPDNRFANNEQDRLNLGFHRY